MSGIDWLKLAQLEEAVPGAQVQVANTTVKLAEGVRRSFPINGVPDGVVDALQAIAEAAGKAEDAIQALGVLMVELSKEGLVEGYELPGAEEPEPEPDPDSAHRPASRHWKPELVKPPTAG